AFAPGARPVASRAALVAGDYANRPRHCDRPRRCKPCQDFATDAKCEVAIEPAVSVKNDVCQGTATAKLCSGPTIDGYVSAKMPGYDEVLHSKGVSQSSFLRSLILQPNVACSLNRRILGRLIWQGVFAITRADPGH